MPLTPNFSVSQSAMTPESVTVTDTSTGSDVLVASRRIFFQTASGQYLVEDGVTTDYNEWPVANVSQTFSVLDKDQALAITVQWLDVSNSILYSLTQLYCLAQFNKQFHYYLIQQLALTPNIIRDKNYFQNLATYWAFIIGAVQAIEVGADVSASQHCLDQATNMKNNQSIYF